MSTNHVSLQARPNPAICPHVACALVPTIMVQNGVFGTIGLLSQQLCGALALHSSEKKRQDADMVMLQKTRIYKILSASDWAHAEQVGHTETALDEGDGYVHLSTRAQVAETLSLHYAGQAEVRLLEFIAEQMSGPLRWEQSRGGQLFPHLYARLRPDAAERTWTLSLNQDAIPQLPPDIDA